MAVARGFRNSSSCGVENKLKTIKLTARKIEKKRVTVVNLEMNKRRSDGLSRGIVESVGSETLDIYVCHSPSALNSRFNYVLSYYI